MDIFITQTADQIGQKLILACHQFGTSCHDLSQQLVNINITFWQTLETPIHKLAKAGNAHHEEFIQIICRNGQKPNAFSGWFFFILSQRQDTLIKSKPAKLAVKKVLVFS